MLTARLPGDVLMRPWIALSLTACTAIAPFDFSFGDGGVGGDASVSQCPSPCFGDLAADFVPMEQGNGALAWRYLEDGRGPSGVDYDALEWGAHEGADAFVAAGGSPPAIVSCGGAEICAGVSGHLLAISDPEGGGSDATFELTATDDAVYRIMGSYRSPDGVSSTSAHRFWISRRSRYDVLADGEFFPSTSEGTFDVTASLLANDPVRITLIGGSESVAVALSAYATNGGTFPGDCQLALTFDGGSLTDACSGTSFAAESDSIADPDPGAPSTGASFDASHGDAMVFVEGQQVRSLGPALDHRGDFTVQLWARFEEGAMNVTGTLFTDATSEDPPGGAYLRGDLDGTMYFGTFYEDPMCDMGICDVFAMATRPTDGGWHFYRLVRRTSDETMRLCIDGRLVGSTPVPGDVDLTTAYPPYIGRNVVFNPAYFVGAIDEVRVFSSALPCGAP